MPLVSHRRKDRRAGSAGFTLVELSVVISMTALLTALLLPALSTAKEKSRRAVCKSNIRQLMLVMKYYADDNQDILPSSADNKQYYHSIRLSDQTFSNLVAIAGTSNIFYCPNIVFSSGGSNSVVQHDAYGYVIGYSYLARDIQTTTKGNDYFDYPTRSTDSPTNELIADANFWTPNQTAGSLPSQLKIAPHGALGAAMVRGSSFTVGLSGTSPVSIGAMGGNIGFLDWSVQWHTIKQMQTYSASSVSDAYGNW